jgi:hypothetical protein
VPQLPGAAEAPELPAPSEVLSEPQAASASVAVKAMPATQPTRWSFTVFPSDGVLCRSLNRHIRS